MYYKGKIRPSELSEATPDLGPSTDPNPGERSLAADRQGAPLNSLGTIPAKGNRAGGGQHIDTGARVGMMRNLEFTAGGRAHRVSVGSFSTAAPAYDPRSGEIHTSTATDAGSPSVGGASGMKEPAMAPHVEGAGATNDTSAGDTGPGRRRDTRTP